MTATVGIPIIDDDLVEPDETFRVLIANPGPTDGVTLGGRTGVTVTIDSEDMGSVEFESADLNVGEGGNTVLVELRLSGGTLVGPDTVIPLVTTDGSAMAGTHYTTVTSGTISAGSNNVFVTIPITDDDVDNTDRMFTVSLGTPLPTDITSGTVTEITVTIIDDDDPAPAVPALSVAAVPTTIAEGAASTITITATTAPAGNLTIPYTIAGANITAGDYTLTGATNVTGLTGNVTLATNQTSVELTLTAADDADTDPETLTFTLDTPGGTAGYTVATATATITIEQAAASTGLTVEFSTASVSFNELSADNNATNQVTFDVVLSGLLRGGAAVEIPVMTTAGTATADTDYTTLSTMLTFTAGSPPSQEVSIEIASDDLYETDETFTVIFGDLAGSGVTAGTVSVVTVTIDDDDTLTVDFVGGVLRSVNENAGPLEITMRLSAAPGADVSIPYNVRGTTATFGEDFSTPSGNLNGNMAEFMAGGDRETVLSFPIVRDRIDEINNIEIIPD